MRCDILHRVVIIDMGVAPGADCQVNQRMAREKLQHVVKKADAGGDPGLAGAIKIERELDLRFACRTADAALAHEPSLVSGEKLLKSAPL